MGGEFRKCWLVFGGLVGKWRRKEVSIEGIKEWVGLGVVGFNFIGVFRGFGRDFF